MSLSENLLKLGSSILPRANRATNRNNVAVEKRYFFLLNFFFLFIFEIYIEDFYFWSYGHCCDVITPIFDDNSKNKYRRIFLLFFPFYSAHSAPFINFPPLLRGGVCMSVIGKKPLHEICGMC